MSSKFYTIVAALLCFTQLGAQPTISSFSPLWGPVGTTITISGTNFSADASSNTVYFGDVKVPVLAATTTSLVIEAPAGSSFKPITVTVNGKTASSAASFAVMFIGGSANLLAHHFIQQLDIPTGTHPSKLASGDLDGDGKTDVVVTNSGSNTFSILRNTSSMPVISFAPKTDLATGTDPRSVTINDLDGDGLLDVAVANFGSNTVSIFRNTSTAGNISFASKVDITTGAAPQTIYAGDIDSDGRLDLVTANNAGSSVSVFLNASAPGTISFAAKTDITVGINPYAVIVADYNNDGMRDIAVTYDAQTVGVFRNTGTTGVVSFAVPQTFTVAGNPTAITSFDINLNDRPEIFLATYTGQKIEFLINTSGQNPVWFGPAGTYNAGAALDMFAADVDGDSRADLVLPDENLNRVIVQKNRYFGIVPIMFNFSQFSTGTQPVGVVAADFDGDGRPDIVTANYNTGSVTVLRNQVGEAKVTPAGTNPVSGIINNMSRFDASVQVYNGKPYVQRHYDINPVNNASSATATVTLYYQQQDFNNFNAHPSHGMSLPSGPADNANKANLRIYQFHGFSASGDPGTYPGPGVVIDPDDDKIIWNSDAQVWEVTFDVTGFSGFFAGSAGSSILPVNLVSFNALRQANTALVQWSTSREIITDHFELQRSVDGRNYGVIAIIPAAGNSGNIRNYNYQDKLGADAVYYYRLKIVDKDGNTAYSKIVPLRAAETSLSVNVYPNPASGFATVYHPISSAAAWIQLVDVTGRVVRASKVMSNGFQSVLDLRNLSAGIYKVVWRNGKSTISTNLVVQ